MTTSVKTGVTDDVAALRERDNATNWWPLARVWLIIALTIALGLIAEREIALYNLPWAWNVVVVVAAMIIIGASQHQLGGVIHEGTHSLLFADKRLNELVSDWCAAFPVYTTTYQFRVHHLAHHQFVNDPVRDPDIAQLKDSHHWLDFPIAPFEMVKAIARQLWLPNIIRYTLVRARYSAVGHDGNPYIPGDGMLDRAPLRVGLMFAVGTAFLVNGVILATPNAMIAHATLIGAYLATITYFYLLPDERFPGTRLQPVISHRATAIGRMTFLFAIYWPLTAYDAGTQTLTAWNTFGRYWVWPLFTTFPLFMMLRQWVQHGNADRGRYTNTRVFLFGPFIRYAVFPWGMDYHLPHHVMASVPHYNLPKLHAALNARDPNYAENGIEVEGVWHAPAHDHDHQLEAATTAPKRLSLIHVLGSRAHIEKPAAVYIDNAALAYTTVNDQAAIAQVAERSSKDAPLAS